MTPASSRRAADYWTLTKPDAKGIELSEGSYRIPFQLPGGDQTQAFEVAQEQTQRLGRMIDEVLHVSQLEQGMAQRHVTWTPVSLTDVLRSVLLTLRQEASVKGLLLTSAIAAEVPVLAGDEGLLQSLAFHLVENAVKFTPAGGKVDVGLEANSDEVVLRVRDDGIGILLTDHNVAETLRITDRAYVVWQGKVIAHGPPEQIVSDEKVIQVYLGRNFKAA